MFDLKGQRALEIVLGRDSVAEIAGQVVVRDGLSVRDRAPDFDPVLADGCSLSTANDLQRVLSLLPCAARGARPRIEFRAGGLKCDERIGERFAVEFHRPGDARHVRVATAPEHRAGDNG